MLRRLLDDDDDFDRAFESASQVATISIGIIIAIVVGTIIFLVVSVIVCIYCVCKKHTFSSGRVLTRGGAPAQQVTTTTYSFPAGAGVVQPTGPTMVQPPPPGPMPQPYGAYPPPGPQYPPAGPPQAYPPATAGGWNKPSPGVATAPPPYTPQAPPMGFSDHQKASAPPME